MRFEEFSRTTMLYLYLLLISIAVVIPTCESHSLRHGADEEMFATGATGAARDDSKWFVEARCEDHEDCASCVSSSKCGWDASKDVCVEGKRSMVSQFFYFDFCPSLSCAEYTSCVSCISDSLCGYCGENGGCVEGDEKGPIAGVDSLEGCASGFVYSPAPRVAHELIGVFARADYGGGGDSVHRSKEDIQIKLGELCDSPFGDTTRIAAERITRPALSVFGEVYRPNPEDEPEDQSMFDRARDAFKPDHEFHPKTCAPCRGAYPYCDCSKPEPEIEAPTGSYAMDLAMDYPATGGMDDFEVPSAAAMTGPCEDAATETKEQSETLDDLKKEIDGLLNGRAGPSERDVEEEEEREEEQGQEQQEIEEVKDRVDAVTDNLADAVSGLVESSDDDDSDVQKETETTIESTIAKGLQDALSNVPPSPTSSQKSSVRDSMEEMKNKISDVARVTKKEAQRLVNKGMNSALASNVKKQIHKVESGVEKNMRGKGNNNAKKVTNQVSSEMKTVAKSAQTMASSLKKTFGTSQSATNAAKKSVQSGFNKMTQNLEQESNGGTISSMIKNEIEEKSSVSTVGKMMQQNSKNSGSTVGKMEKKKNSGSTVGKMEKKEKSQNSKNQQNQQNSKNSKKQQNSKNSETTVGKMVQKKNSGSTGRTKQNSKKNSGSTVSKMMNQGKRSK